MQIAILTFDGFNEIDSFVTLNILNRVSLHGWKAEIASPSEFVSSMNGVRIAAQQPLEFANVADVVVVGSGRATRQIIEDHAIMSKLNLDPARQLIGSQCSGALILDRLGLVDQKPVSTDRASRPYLERNGVEVLNQAFICDGNIATAGGCLSSYYLASWVIWRLAGEAAVKYALNFVVPVGEELEYMARVSEVVGPYIEPSSL